METSDVERIVGRLEGAVAPMQDQLSRILDNQETAREQMEHHITDDRDQFVKINEGLGGIRDRLVRVEFMADAIDSHGDAITTIEDRLSRQESDARVLASIRANNLRWIGAAAALGTVTGTAGTAVLPKIWAAVQTWFKYLAP